MKFCDTPFLVIKKSDFPNKNDMPVIKAVMWSSQRVPLRDRFTISLHLSHLEMLGLHVAYDTEQANSSANAAVS
jgi:hypothetical protein